MSTEDFEDIKEIIYRLNVWDDGTHGEDTSQYQYQRIIAETLLRTPESVREKVLDEAIFIIIGGAQGCVWLGVVSEDQSEDQVIKTSKGLVYVKLEMPIILINFAEMDRDNLDEEKMRSTVAHEIAHFILGHHRSVSWSGSGREEETDDLIVKWGFKRAYQNYERFTHSYGKLPTSQKAKAVPSQIHKIILQKGDKCHATKINYRKPHPLANWKYRFRIVINHMKVVSTQYDFPVLITEVNMPDEFWEYVKADGSDIVVTIGDQGDWVSKIIKLIQHKLIQHKVMVTQFDGINKLKIKLVGIDTVRKKMELWVKIPKLSSIEDTEIYLYYNNRSLRTRMECKMKKVNQSS